MNNSRLQQTLVSIQIRMYVQEETETASCYNNVEERGSSGEIPMKKPCQVDRKTAEMVQFDGCIFVTVHAKRYHKSAK